MNNWVLGKILAKRRDSYGALLLKMQIYPVVWWLITLSICLIITGEINEEKIKSLQFSESLDQQEIKTLQQHQESLARMMSPEFLKALKEFTEEVKTENRYLASFKP